MDSEIVKFTILVVYINFIKIAKFNYLKKVNINYKNSRFDYFGVHSHYSSSARVLTLRSWIFHYFTFREYSLLKNVSQNIETLSQNSFYITTLNQLKSNVKIDFNNAPRSVHSSL